MSERQKNYQGGSYSPLIYQVQDVMALITYSLPQSFIANLRFFHIQDFFYLRNLLLILLPQSFLLLYVYVFIIIAKHVNHWHSYQDLVVIVGFLQNKPRCVAYHETLCLQEGTVLGSGGGQLGAGLVGCCPGNTLAELILKLVYTVLQNSLFFFTFMLQLCVQRRKETSVFSSNIHIQQRVHLQEQDKLIFLCI